MNPSRLPQSPFQFLDDVLVECPRCQGLGHVLAHRMGPPEPPRFVCSGCGHTADSPKRRHWPYQTVIDGRDPVFGLPLWLREPMGGHTVWAYNWRHYDDLLFLLEGDWRAHRHGRAGATFQPHISYRPRYPKWMMLATNRPAILRALARMKKRRFGK